MEWSGEWQDSGVNNKVDTHMLINRPGLLDSPWGPNFRLHKALTAANMNCIQGSLNLLPNGEDDGGLAVFEGSHKLHEVQIIAWQHAFALMNANLVV
jgi:hypothetical protein